MGRIWLIDEKEEILAEIIEEKVKCFEELDLKGIAPLGIEWIDSDVCIYRWFKPTNKEEIDLLNIYFTRFFDWTGEGFTDSDIGTWICMMIQQDTDPRYVSCEYRGSIDPDSKSQKNYVKKFFGHLGYDVTFTQNTVG